MRCRNCGADCTQTGAESEKVQEDLWQTTRFYKCRKCGSKFEVVSDVNVGGK